MEFVKVHGAGNDFVLLPDLDDVLDLTPELTRALCAPHTGLGADGVIRLGPARDGPDADVFMDYRNADGGTAEMCGNGVRCVAKHVLDRGVVHGDRVRVDTRGGVKVVEVAARHQDGRVATLRVDMGTPVVGPVLRLKVPAADGGAEVVDLQTVSMGNPHAVAIVADAAAVPLDQWAPVIAAAPDFPEGTNVEVVTVVAPDRVRGRIWERGVGETLASGTGSCAMAVAAHLRAATRRDVTVELPGGALRVAWDDPTLHVTGPAVEVAAGTLDDTWLAALGAATVVEEAS